MFNASRNMVNSLKNVDRARKFHTAAKTGVNFLGDVLAPNTINAFKSLKTSKNVTQNLSNISRASKVFGGAYRDFRSLNLALAESNMEAGFVYNDMIGNGIAIKQQQNDGQPLSTEDMLDVQEKADRAAFATAQFNAPVIYLTNQLVLGNALGGRAFQKLLKEPVKGFPGRVLRTGSLRTATGEIVQSPFEYVGKGLRGGFKRIKAAGIKGGLRAAGGASLRMFAANVGEGVQELYQEGVQVGTQTYFTEMLKAPTSTGHDYFNIALNIPSAIFFL